MKTRLRIFFLPLCAFAAMSVSAQISQSVKDIAPYVYPQNKPAAPPSFAYAPDGQGYLLLSADARTIDRYDIATGKKIETVFDATHTRESTIDAIEGFEMSQNGRYLLVYTNSEPIYRYSFTAEYYVYEVRTRLLKPLSTTYPRQRAPLMSSDGRMVAFVAAYDNNIYIRKNDYGSEVQVTTDGAENEIINGVPDWVYEEEFSTQRSMVWAPDNLMLCYLKYNETAVPLYSLPIYQGTCDPKDQYALYPGNYEYKYPVAGEPNSIVTLHSYDVETRKIKDITLPDNKIEYIPRIAYGPDPECLLVSTLNRDQNHFEIYSVNPKSTVSKSVYMEESKAWIAPETYENLQCLDDGFVVQSSRTGYSHLYKYSYAGALKNTYTSGDFDVTDFYGVDAKGNCFYQAAYPSPLDRTVNKIDTKGKTSIISKGSGTTSASFSPDMAYAMLRYSDASTPPIYTINSADGKQLRVLEDNASYAQRMAAMPKKEFFTMTSDGNILNGYIIRSNASGAAPVVMYQYSGPGSQSVLNNWTMDWDNYFATQGITVVCVDGRGTGGRGRAFMDVVYKRLGYYETIDQVNAARWVAQQSWADPKKIGIFGWSYGGYETLMAASADGAPYAAALAVAPVTSWRFYDSIYTERYMLTPQQNEANYRTSSPINRTASLCCPLLIMYGTADDNVHPQNSLQYVSMLQSQGGFCDMLVFPNMNHSIYGCNSRSVVYGRMFDYFCSHLK
ncbi:MAG: alpha/beta fold hydrolase [Bacteroidales bacterium]|nr:alpha/beta fold hydrolase [Bacteroidales bacterium]